MHSDFVKPLLLWYNARGRDLPWRKTKDPYRIWVSEIMLQQTRVEAVIRYYERFLNALPDVQALAVCPEDELNKLWEGLGYYSRARNMKKAAVAICSQYGGKMPEDANELRKLPGIGDYTSGAIASIAFGKKEPAVDGNVIRVVSRLRMMENDFSSLKEKKMLAESLRSLTLPENENWGTLNQAFMDLGSAVCLPNSAPHCSECPVADFCKAHKAEKEMEFPIRREKKARQIREMTVFLIRDGDKMVIRKRPRKGLLSNLYEFPNTEGYMNEKSAVRFAEELTGTEAVRITEAADARHIFSHVEWHMKGYEIFMTPLAMTTGEKSGSLIYADAGEIEERYPIPSAFSAYALHLGIRLGKKGKGLNH